MTFTQLFPRIVFWLSVLLIFIWFYQGQVADFHLTKLTNPNENLAMVEPNLGSMLENLSNDLQKLPPTTKDENGQKAEAERQKAIQQAEDAKLEEQKLAIQAEAYKKFNDYLVEQQKEADNKKMKPVPIIVSALFGLCSLYIIVSRKYTDEATKWACGTAGIIIGFWLGGV